MIRKNRDYYANSMGLFGKKVIVLKHTKEGESIFRMKKTVWDIAYDLETIAEKKFGCNFAHSNTIFDRAVIEKDMFYDVMYLLLCMYGSEGSSDFQDKYYELKRINMNEIQNYKEIFEEFKKLLIN